jgi:photosystem II stability/assembly factor-like uncharacterized protein
VRRALGPVGLLALIVVAGAGAFLLGKRAAEGPNDQVAPPARGLPETPDYHSLYVDPGDPQRLLLGTHVGMYESRTGGVTWTIGALGGDDVMNIVRAPDDRMWVAGHNVLARSDDGGETWSDVRPDGLPHRDLHGFAVDPEGRLYAAAAGEGLYVSRDGGASFEEVSDEVGGEVYGLLALEGGRLLAADLRRGLLASDDGGSSWAIALSQPVIRLAAGSGVLLATGERIWRSRDGGKTWQAGFRPGSAFEAIAASGSVAFAVTPQTRTLYRSDDGGEDWSPVG